MLLFILGRAFNWFVLTLFHATFLVPCSLFLLLAFLSLYTFTYARFYTFFSLDLILSIFRLILFAIYFSTLPSSSFLLVSFFLLLLIFYHLILISYFLNY